MIGQRNGEKSRDEDKDATIDWIIITTVVLLLAFLLMFTYAARSA